MKLAYPQGFQPFIAAPYNLSKWTQTMEKILQLKSLHQEYGVDDILDFMTKEWNVVEKNDFKNWMQYYRSGEQNKYKTAQFNMDILKATLPPKSKEEVFQELEISEPSRLNDKDLIRKKIQSAVNRLGAAEKIITDPQTKSELINLLGETGYRKLLEELHAVKRQIQSAPIRNIQSTLLEDLIYRKGSILSKQGFTKAGSFMKAIAQMPVEQPQKEDQESQDSKSKPVVVTPPTTNTPPKNVPSLPTPPSLPNMMANPQNNTNSPPKSNDNGEEAIKDLIRGMNIGDENDSNDINDIVDIEDDPISEMHITAQLAPEPIATEPIATPPQLDESIEDPMSQMQPSENMDEIEVVDEPQPMQAGAEDIFDAALENITIDNLVEELERAANILRKRELPRILSRVDLYMDKLQFSSFFPQIGEAQSKSLDSNQYSLTRVEEVLSKLRGALKTPTQDQKALEGDLELPQINPQLEGVKNNLQTQEEQDKARKEKRKQEEIEKSEPKAPPTPITNVQEDLGQPVELPPAPPKPQLPPGPPQI